MKNSRQGFKESLISYKSKKNIPLIVDFKCISPGEGLLFTRENALDNAKLVESLGVPAISVVTEPEEFGGSLEMLEELADSIEIPILRKDFIKSREDIKISRECGASSVLLIASCMSADELTEYFHYANEIGIEPLVETHDESEMALATELGATLVGINNRNILELEKDGGTVSTTTGLAGLKKEDMFLISESGILSYEDAVSAVNSGADAVLIGTAVWRAPSPANFIRQFTDM